MTSTPSLTASPPIVWLCSAAMLLLMYMCGRLLVPQMMRGTPKLPLLAFQLASGMIFLTGVSALVILGHMSYIGFMPLIQIAMAAWFFRQARQSAAVENRADEAGWTRAEVLSLITITALASWFFQLPYECALGDGRLREIHEDLGYFMQLVIALPEAGAANGWASVLAEHSTAAGGVRDTWYHWGAIFLASAVRGVTGMPAISALLGVTGHVMNVLLVIAAAGVAGSLCSRLTMRGQLIAGVLSITCVQVMKFPALYGWLAAILPYDTFHHARVPLGLIFPYKYESILVLAALGAWLRGKNVAAVMMLFLAACSAPHTVAAVGVIASPLIALGLVLREARMWKTGAVATATVLCGWAFVTMMFGSALPKGKDQSHFIFDMAELTHAVGWGTVDAIVALAIGVISLIGILHLILARDEDANPHARLLGWMAVGGVLAASIALQALHRMADRFHVVVFTHSLLVLPAGMWGLVRMISTRRDWMRPAALALATASVLMGMHDILLPVVKNKTTVWAQADVAAIKHVLRGRPVGYYAAYDRGWWIPKLSLLGSLLDTRIVRLNPLDQRDSVHTRFYGSDAPFHLLPPGKSEPVFTWSLRFAEKVGVRHVIETWEDRLPKSVRAKARPVMSAAGLMLYELPPFDDTPAPVAGVAQSAP